MPPADTDVRPTDVLANERTFLAYLRTALSLMAFGFVISRFALFLDLVHGSASQPQQHVTEAVGIAFAILGCLLAGYGLWRYWTTDRALRRGTVVRGAVSGAVIETLATILLGLIIVAGLARIL